jgi:hypothetical protein
MDELADRGEMKSTVSQWRCRQLVYGMVALLAFPCGPARAAGIPVTGQQSDTPPSSASQPSPQSPVAPGPQTSAPPVSSAATPAQSGQQAPVGTAAAPYENKIGVAASRPAGVVIAPAKQKRERSLVIKVGLIVGGAIAVGTVVGLSAASSSRPH